MRFKWLLVSGLFGVGLLLLLFTSTSVSFTYDYTTNENSMKISNSLVAQVGAAVEDTGSEFWPLMWKQIDGVLSFTAQIIDAVGGAPGQLFDVAANDPPQTQADLANIDPSINANSALRGVPAPSVYGGTLIANVPLEVTDRLTVRGVSQLTDLFVTGAFSINDLDVPGAASIGALAAGGTQLGALTVSGNTQLNTLSVSGPVSFANLTASNLTVTNSLLALSGINTQGADVDLGGGNVYAANILNSLTAGDNITISGTPNAPVISADVPRVGSRVRSLNGINGTLTLVAGTDMAVTVSGSNITLANTSDLGTVAGRGGCTDCILDADVIDSLTIASGTIDNTIIGSTTPAEAYFTTITVTDAATSTFGGPINVTSGCVAVNGVCLGIGVTNLADLLDVTLSGLASNNILRYDGSEWVNVDLASLGIGDGSYLGLTDTPSTYLTGAVPFANATSSGLTQSTNLTFDGNRLALGSTTPVTTLTVAGDVSLLGQQATRYYDLANSNYVGFRASTTLSGTTVWTLPETDGTADQFIVTDGAGNLRFTDLSGLGAVSALGDLSDVNLSGPVYGDVLVFDGANWVDQATSTLGLGNGSFTGLSDTPGALIADAILFADATGANVTQSTNFIFDGTNLAVGAASAVTTLTVGGDISLLNRQAARFYDTGSSNYVGLRASTSVASNLVWTLPVSDGSPDYVLVTDGSGNLRFSDVQAVGGGATTYLELNDTPGSYTANAIPYVSTSSDQLLFSSNLVYNGAAGFFGIGTNNPSDELTVHGSVYIGFDENTPGIFYDDADDTVSVGTTLSEEKFTVAQGSILQRGGTTSEPYAPTYVGELNLSDTANDIYVVGNYAYVVTAGSLKDFHIINIANKRAPTVVGTLDLPAGGTSVYVVGDYAYVTSESAGADFHIIDVSDPTAPFQVGSLDLGSTGYGVTARGRYAYAVAGNAAGNDFHVIDIYDPVTPRIVGGLNLAADGNDVRLAGDYAYVVTDTTASLRSIDISDPTAPTVTDTVSFSSDVISLEIRGTFAYVASGPTGGDFYVMDISDPADITQVDSISLSSTATGVSVSGKYAYITTTGSDLYVVDMSDPASLQEVGTVDLGTGSLFGVHVIGRYAYLVSAASGQDFHIYDITGVEAQSVLAHSIESGNMSVYGNIVASGDLSLSQGLSTGAEGIQSAGTLLIQGSGTSIFSGNIAIGTTTEAYQLAAQGDVFIGGQLYGSDYQAGANGELLMANGTGQVWTATSSLGLSSAFTTSAQLAGLLTNETGTGNVVFSDSPTLTGTAVFADALFDQVGIGTTTPSAALHVYDTSSVTMLLESQTGDALLNLNASNGVGDFGAITFYKAGTFTNQLYTGSDTDDNLYIDTSSSNTYVIFEGAGVGIGTTTPSAVLSVEGAIQSSDLYGGSTGLSTDAQGNIIRTPSDERLKRNVATIDGALDTVLALRGVSYQWIDTERFGDQTEVGFLAQEVDLILPEVVRKGGDYWSLNTQNIVAVIVEAIKEMWVAITGQGEQIEALEERVLYLESLLDASSVPASSGSARTPTTESPESTDDETEVNADEEEVGPGIDDGDTPESDESELVDSVEDVLPEEESDDSEADAVVDDTNDVDEDVIVEMAEESANDAQPDEAEESTTEAAVDTEAGEESADTNQNNTAESDFGDAEIGG